MTLTNTVTRTPTANVFGVLRGSDPALADRVRDLLRRITTISASASRIAADPTDTIYNGAMDNASGVGMLLAIGERVRARCPQRPRRSIMLLFAAAEEQGLIGSQYFAEHPPMPPGRIAANINFDSGNIWGETRDITFIGLRQVEPRRGRARRSPIIRGARSRAISSPIAASTIDPTSSTSPRSACPRSTSTAAPTSWVARAGWGAEQVELYEANHYHQPSDELTPEWNFDGMVQDARFGFYAGLIVANDDALPQWNAGNEFEAARRAALEALR